MRIEEEKDRDEGRDISVEMVPRQKRDKGMKELSMESARAKTR